MQTWTNCFRQEHYLVRIPARIYSKKDPAIDELQFCLCVALKEPNIRESRDGFLLRVDSPPDLVRLLPSSTLLRGLAFPSSPSHESPAKLKDRGNLLFSQMQWRPACDMYSLALDLATSLDHPRRLSLFSNRAASLLKLNLPGSALRDCEAALSHPLIDTPESALLKLKVLFRASSAAYRLQRFDLSFEYMSSLLAIRADDLDALDLYRRIELRQSEAVRGAYDWPTLFASSRTATSLDVAEYTSSAIVVKEIQDRGRGLVAARDIVVGELLVVAKPLAMGVADPSRKSYVVGANLFTETKDPYAANDVVALLIERLADDPTIRSKVFDLHPGDDLKRFTKILPDDSGVDTSRLEGIATFNAFHTESLTEKTTTSSLSDEAANNAHAPSSLYHFPSYLNHSCIGNCTYSFLADTIFFRARNTIKKGEELVDSYVDSLEVYESRKQKLDKHGFVCSCELCFWDMRDGASRSASRKKLAEELEQLTDRIHGEKSCEAAEFIEKMKDFIEKIEGTYLNERPEGLKPTLYSAYRLLAQTLAGSGNQRDAIGLEVKGLRALGAVFTGELEDLSLMEAPRLGDVNAVLSSLFIAKQLSVLGDSPGSRFA